ncbi:aldehyde dehydrogenase family protein, partial [Nesterenkonia haasae]|uniref:aldehyde dehydrogenase family protein n=1 Tax=Nesterenkonia haasae TaxID=2587813 RepID=UPI0013917C81
MFTTGTYIAGAWVEAHGTERIDVINAATEETLGSVPAGDEVDVDRAADAARAAFPKWSSTSR